MVISKCDNFSHIVGAKQMTKYTQIATRTHILHRSKGYSCGNKTKLYIAIILKRFFLPHKILYK